MKTIKLITIAIVIGVIITLSTYFYQRDTGNAEFIGVCAIDYGGPCNGEEFSDHGYPISFIDPDNNLDIKALAYNIIFWTVLAFVTIKTVDYTILRKRRNL